jgi:hypothetical protein
MSEGFKGYTDKLPKPVPRPKGEHLAQDVYGEGRNPITMYIVSNNCRLLKYYGEWGEHSNNNEDAF